MKTILIISLLFLVGCIGNQFEHIKYDPNGKISERWNLQGGKAMVNDEKQKLLIVLSDGSILSVGHIITVADPNSAEAIGKAVGAGAKLFIQP